MTIEAAGQRPRARKSCGVLASTAGGAWPCESAWGIGFVRDTIEDSPGRVNQRPG